LIRSFIDFTLNEFGGFAYQRVTTNKKIGQRLVSELLSTSDDNLYVGIQYGMAGLINRAWLNADFLNNLVSVSDQENGWQYLRLSEFKIVATWAMDPSIQNAQGLRIIRWQGMPFWPKKLYVVAKAAGDGIWIGIRGGLSALKAMSREDILNRKSWQVSYERKNASWFSGKDFCEVLESKGITFDTAKGD
jgi:hypothetical protein